MFLKDFWNVTTAIVPMLLTWYNDTLLEFISGWRPSLFYLKQALLGMIWVLGGRRMIGVSAAWFVSRATVTETSFNIMQLCLIIIGLRLGGVAMIVVLVVSRRQTFFNSKLLVILRSKLSLVWRSSSSSISPLVKVIVTVVPHSLIVRIKWFDKRPRFLQRRWRWVRIKKTISSLLTSSHISYLLLKLRSSC